MQDTRYSIGMVHEIGNDTDAAEPQRQRNSSVVGTLLNCHFRIGSDIPAVLLQHCYFFAIQASQDKSLP